MSIVVLTVFSQREGTDSAYCLCQELPSTRRRRIESSLAAQLPPATGYPRDDPRLVFHKLASSHLAYINYYPVPLAEPIEQGLVDFEHRKFYSNVPTKLQVCI